jgi:oligopeptide transport system ATP-binding protein
MALLEVTNLAAYFHTREGVVRAVDGISYRLEAGETLGIVGESGSGKSVSCYALLGLLPMPPGKIESGTALLDGDDLLLQTSAQLRALRGKKISMIFQDPMTALNPYMTIGAQLTEPLIIHEGASKTVARRKALDMMDAVGIQDGEKRLRQYPHEFSGGMRQRVMIAMALITKPDVLIADEPTTALDVTVQAQILELIQSMQKEMGMAVILITHDLGVIAGTCDRVLVMYAGKVVESAVVKDLFREPRHPYTEALMASLPSVNRNAEELYTISGLPPDLSQPLSGCAFEPRCEQARPLCSQETIALKPLADSRATACVRVQRGEL